MFGLVRCNVSILHQQNTDPDLIFVRSVVKHWLWPIITFFGVTGNILSIIVLTKRRMIMSSTNNYLIALALVDIAYLILTLIINTLQNPCFLHTSLAEIAYTICRPIADFSSNASVWLTVTFTVERWVAITYPLQSRTWCTVYLARKIILTVICASLLCALPSAFEMKLERVNETQNVSNTTIYKSYIKAKPTELGNSLLYRRIYFNFVTFAIIWIPLLLLLIFNTRLIAYVRRSKQNDKHNSDGIQLRRHNRGNQGEQRKTTIMLIAVVIVFTVCQIPQAISLTVQSFFPKVSQSSKVLIYNNFANCFVALNASINFLLYCSFSDRFRSTFRSNFTFLSKYYSHYIQPKLNAQTKPQPYKHASSFENMSVTNQTHIRLSSTSVETPAKNYYRRQSNVSRQNENSHYCCFSFFTNKFHTTIHRNLTQEIRSSRSTSQCISAPMSSSLIFIEQPTQDNLITNDDHTTKEKQSSLRLYRLTRPILKFQKCHSTILNNKIEQQIWVKRHASNNSTENILNQPKTSNWNEIVDVSV